MQQFQDKVAVITGAASGIGRTLALRAAHEGMRVVLADIEIDPLTTALHEVRSIGAQAIAVPTDVSQAEQVQALAQTTIAHFERVDLLFNNAGVAAGGSIWESSIDDWQWVLDINLWGVIHGLRSFVPLMLAHGGEGVIVNTASVGGMVVYHPSAPYQVSKHAVVALTEQLHVSLMLRGAALRAAVLCPGPVHTRILEAARHRPVHGAQPPIPAEEMPEEMRTMLQQALTGEMSPEMLADLTFAAIRDGRFYIFTHADLLQPIRERAEHILHATLGV